MYYVYMLRCSDNTIYTGFSTDWKRRFAEHSQQGKRCAKYTLVHRAVCVEALWSTADKSGALKLEYMIKTLTKAQKEALIKNPSSVFDYFENDMEQLDIKPIKLHNNSN